MENKHNIHKDILLNYIQKSLTENPDSKIDENVAFIRREKVNKPVIGISLNSASFIAGANQLKDRILEYLQERDLNADIIPLGTLGIINYEPVVSIQLPGKTKLLYRNVTDENIIAILDGTLNNFIPEDHVFAQVKNKLHEVWERVPFLHEISF
ncbi:MAG TPA: (2Fe-2S) ferredoxin domain-containing protein, partial [Bacteroidales bacterium]|nr:(2Fe-2S) ferredoxin domain-containing protein [Bacteroidales bacterium]